MRKEILLKRKLPNTTTRSMRSNIKEMIRRKNYEASLFQKSKGATKSHYSKQGDSTKARVLETKIVQKEGSSENCDPMDLGVATWETLPAC